MQLELAVEQGFTAVDIETTGLDPKNDAIIEIAAVRVREGKVDGDFASFVWTPQPISYHASRVNGITKADLKGAPQPAFALDAFWRFAGDDILVFHNAPFDVAFLTKATWKHLRRGFDNRYLDTLALSRKLLPMLGWYRLENLADYFGLDRPDHRALSDARATAGVLLGLAPDARGPVSDMGRYSPRGESTTPSMKRELAAGLPEKPGVYVMRDARGAVVYVGKAKSLRDRVGSYFHNDIKPDKIARLVEEVESIDHIVVGTELGSLLLENMLIKKYWPPYNSQGKRIRDHSFILIDGTDYPTPTVVRRLEGPGSYYGPFSSARTLETLVSLIRDDAKLRHCKSMENGPCLYREIGKCGGPCTGQLSKEEYANRIAPVDAAFSGKPERLLRALRRRLELASKRLEYERAASYRNAISSLESVARTMRPFGGQGPTLDFILLDQVEGIGYLIARGALTSTFTFSDIEDGKRSKRLFRKIAAAYFADDSSALPSPIELDALTILSGYFRKRKFVRVEVADRATATMRGIGNAILLAKS